VTAPAARITAPYWPWLQWTLGEGWAGGRRPFDPLIRPAEWTARVPARYWVRRLAFLAARKVKRPPPAPLPPPAPQPAAEVVVYVAWALQAENGKGFSDPTLGGCDEETFVRRCSDVGVTLILLQAVDENEAHYAPLERACDRHGIRFGLWGIIPDPAAAAAVAVRAGAAVYSAQTELPGDTHPGFVAEFRRRAPGAELITVTDFNGFRPEWLQVPCHAEAYVNDQPWTTVASFIDRAVNVFGWAESQVTPILGGYGAGADLRIYAADVRRRPIGVYLADTLAAGGWTRLGGSP
jgi:hypothetical protein